MSNHAKPRPITTKKVAPRGQVDEERAQLQMALLNMRQMYEAAIQEKMGMEQRLNQAESIIAAKLLESEDSAFTVSQASLDLAAAGGIQGIQIDQLADLQAYQISAVLPEGEGVVVDEPLPEV